MVRDTVCPPALALGAVYLAYAVGHLLRLGPGLLRSIAVAALATAAGLAVLDLARRRWNSGDDRRREAERAALEQRLLDRTAELAAASAAVQRERAERRRIAESLIRYSQALETCSDAIALADLDGTVVETNAALLRLCGIRDRAGFAGRSVLEFLAPEDRESARRHAARAMSRAAGTPREYRLLGPSGTRTPIEATIGPMCDDGGTPLGFVLVARDITERRRVETQLRHSEAYLRTLIEHSSDAIVVLDVDGTILARPHGERSTVGHFGHDQDAVVGRFATHFVHPDDLGTIAEAFRAAGQAPGGSQAVECRVRDGDASWRPAEVRFQNLLDDPTVAGLVCTVSDLSAHKRAQEELRRAKEAAEAASLAKSEFLSTMSHELRTPIHAILGYTEMMQEEVLGPIVADQAKALERIRDRATYQFEMVSAVLALSDVECGRLSVERRELSLADLLAQIAAEGREAWSSAGLTIHWRADPDLPVLSSDPGKLKLVVRNLVGNAVKFTPEGSVTIEAHRARGGAEIRVIDTGIGIPADAHELIFEPFRQLDGSESRGFEGSGLGLHLVKRLLALLGGSIGVRSEPGRGSTFSVWLPVDPDSGSCLDAGHAGLDGATGGPGEPASGPGEPAAGGSLAASAAAG